MTTTSINAKVTAGASVRPFQRPLSLKEAVEWIKNKGYDKITTDFLVQKISATPQGMYVSFLKHIDRHVSEAHVAKRKNEIKEKKEEEQKEVESAGE